MSPKYTLIYYDERGRAEFIRLMFFYLKIDFKDVRLQWGGEEWNKLRHEQPFGKIPVLHVDDQVIAETNAIARYIARENDLAGKTNLESAKCDMLVSALSDFNQHRWQWIMEFDPLKKEDYYKILIEKECPQFFDSLLKQMKDSNFLVGDSVTWADIAVADTLYEHRKTQMDLGNEEKYKSLIDLVDRIFSLPGIKEWVEKRPVSRFP